jgi:D-glycero-alpha-D-manno-heptose 1-phosphate guanylyltransferase
MFEPVVAVPRAESLIAVVLAGGFGTRIRHLHPDVPKPMIPVAGKPFLEWVIKYLAREGVKRIIVSTGFRGEVVERYFADNPLNAVSVRCVREQEPLGTAGGFLHATQSVAPPPSAWLVLNGDSLAPAPLDGLIALLKDQSTLGAVLGVAVPDARRFGTLRVGGGGELLGFVEKRAGAGVINAGVYLFRPELVQLFPKRLPLSFEADVFPALTAEQRKLKVCVTDAPFLDIGTPESLPLAEGFVQANGLLSLTA